jgi:hypothetical protein
VLRRSAIAVEERGWDPRRFTAVRALAGERVLLVDDTWTTGARAQTAAAALLTAGALHGRRSRNRAFHQPRLRGQRGAPRGTAPRILMGYLRTARTLGRYGSRSAGALIALAMLSLRRSLPATPAVDRRHRPTATSGPRIGPGGRSAAGYVGP